MKEQRRCEPCLGRGYKGRWRYGVNNRWKIETCRACGGTGQKYYRVRKTRKPVTK